MKDKRLISVPEAAGRVGVHTNTILRWVKEGILPALRLPGGRLRISVHDLDQLLTRSGR